MARAALPPPLEAALLDLQRRRIALTEAFMALRTAAPARWDRSALTILLAYLALRRSRLRAQAVFNESPLGSAAARRYSHGTSIFNETRE